MNKKPAPKIFAASATKGDAPVCVCVCERVLCLSACVCGPLKVTEFPFNLETPQLRCQIIISTVILFRFSLAAVAKKYLFIYSCVKLL